MELRVTFDTMMQRSLANTRRQADRLAVLTQQAQTGNRILQPSDDPVGAVAVLANRAHDERLSMYLTNISEARTKLDVSVATLQEVGQTLTRARDLTIEAAHSGNDAAAYTGLATEMDALLTRLRNLANTQHEGRYLYAGTAVHTEPFALDSATGVVSYQGARERADVAINQNQTVDVYFTGSEVFQARQRQATVFTGQTGAAPGAGTDSATGQGTLQVWHTATTYAAGSGVLPGASSVAGDTVLGPAGAHQLTIVDTSGTGASGTVSLNGGPTVAFTNADTDLRVQDANGAEVYLDTTAITPGFNGNVSITADGTLSIDGGATTLPINFTASQVVTNGGTGAVTHVNTTNVRRAGDEHVEYPGTYDAFQLLAALRDDFSNTRGLSSGEQVKSIAGRLAELDRIRNQVLEIVGEQAANLQNLQGLENQIGDIQLESRRLAADLEGADLAEVVLNLQSQQTLFQTTLAATARFFDQSLLDFIR